ncbi:MAG: hypothetical protein JXM68_13030 [Sedimentisphaerales bacterium]|nr:hypothetical protein [Sedimentisphaerales bacterium]
MNQTDSANQIFNRIGLLANTLETFYLFDGDYPPKILCGLRGITKLIAQIKQGLTLFAGCEVVTDEIMFHLAKITENVHDQDYWLYTYDEFDFLDDATLCDLIRQAAKSAHQQSGDALADLAIRLEMSYNKAEQTQVAAGEPENITVKDFIKLYTDFSDQVRRDRYKKDSEYEEALQSFIDSKKKILQKNWNSPQVMVKFKGSIGNKYSFIELFNEYKRVLSECNTSLPALKI